MTHTLGEWELIEDGSGLYIAGPIGYSTPTDRRVLLDIWDGSADSEDWFNNLADEDWDNFRVMAAGSSLLVACESTVERLKQYIDNPSMWECFDHGLSDVIQAVVTQAEAAIAKAGGEQP